MKIAILCTDNRENYRNYHLDTPDFGTAPEALLQGFGAVPETEIHIISCAQNRMKSPDKLAGNIWFHSLVVPKIGWLKTGYQGCIRATRNFLSELRPDIVHGQGTERDCAISAVFSGFPNVITIHGNMRLIAKVNKARPFSYVWLAARLERFTIPRAAGVICITRYTQNAVRNLALKTWVVPNAVDQSLFDINRAPKPDPVILCIGAVTVRKNQNSFIAALDPLAEVKSFKVVFLGSASPQNPYGADFFSLIKARPWCEYAGFADRDALKRRLAGARLLALPSLEDNCPMVVLEAMAAGVPVVAAKVGGVPDLIDENVTGIFFDPTNAESMRRAVQRTLENPERVMFLSETAKRQAQERYHPETIARRHLGIYKEILGRAERR